MIRTAAVPRSVRIGTAVLGVAGIATLAGCSGGTTDAAAPAASAAAPSASSQPSTSAAADTGSTSTSGTYTDGTYEATGQYATPESVETVDVTLTIAGDTVTAVEVTGDPQAAESRRYQSEFIGGIQDEVVGKKLDDISVTKVAGSSLTSGGFTKAVDAIKAEAKA